MTQFKTPIAKMYFVENWSTDINNVRYIDEMLYVLNNMKLSEDPNYKIDTCIILKEDNTATEIKIINKIKYDCSNKNKDKCDRLKIKMEKRSNISQYFDTLYNLILLANETLTKLNVEPRKPLDKEQYKEYMDKILGERVKIQDDHYNYLPELGDFFSLLQLNRDNSVNGLLLDREELLKVLDRIKLFFKNEGIYIETPK